MAKVNRKHIKTKEVSDLLDSDDELPDSYEDISFIPAYEDDCRFEPIRFTWLDQQPEDASTEQIIEEAHTYQQSRQSSSSMEADSELLFHLSNTHSEFKTGDKMILISKGVLTKRDIFFVKSIENYATDTTLLWFIDFLFHKSMQPKKIGCLAENIFANHHTDISELTDNLRRFKFFITS